MSALPELPEIASVFTFADIRVALTNYGFACRKAALEEAVAELDEMTCNNATARSAIKLCIETIKDMK